MKYILIGAVAFVLAGCDPRELYSYRYYCQDPANINDEYCTSKQCEVDRECPHHLSPIKAAAKKCEGE